MVKKKDSSPRPCRDFRRLNLATLVDKHPVPNLGDFSSQLEGCTVFNTLDFKNGYLQIPLEKSAVPKTAIITPFGLYEFLCMPFGLKNAGMTFQWYMDCIFNGLDFIFIYIDDILVASKSCKEHIVDLREVLNRLRLADLVLNLPKCTFGCSSVDFLGHLVSSSEGIRPLAAKVEALRSHPQANTIKELQQFLGLLNLYIRFIPRAAKVLAPFTEALKGSPVGSMWIQWSTAMLAAFKVAKNSLSTTAELSHPSPQAKLAMVADASATHVGAPTPAEPPRWPLGATGILFKEAGQGIGQLQHFQQEAPCPLQCCPAFQVPDRRPPLPAVDRPPPPHLRFGPFLRSLDTPPAKTTQLHS